MAIDLNAKTDKLVAAVGEKKVSTLTGTKNTSEFTVNSDKVVSLTGTKSNAALVVQADKSVSLNGAKTISALSGAKTITPLVGATDKNVTLIGSEPDGFWHILISATFITIDNTVLKIDRN